MEGGSGVNILSTLVFASLLGGTGDVLCRFGAAASRPRDMWLFGIGAATCWALGAFLWIHIYRSHSILEMLVLFTPFHSVALGLAGVLIFGEAFTAKLVIAAALSALTVWVMS